MSIRGTITKKKRKGSTIWAIDYTDQNGQRHEEAARDEFRNSTREIAKALLKRRMDEIASGVYATRAIRFKELCDGFVKDQLSTELRKNSYRDYIDIIDLRLRAFLGDSTEVRDITVQRIEALRTHLRIAGRHKPHRDPSKTGLSPASVNKSLMVLHQIFARAARHGIIASNPVQHVKRVRGEQAARVARAERVLSKDEVVRLLDHAQGRYKPLLGTLVYAGLRISEAVALRWRSVNLDSAVLSVDRAIVKREEGEPKSRASRRDVEMTPTLVRMLRVWKLASAHSKEDDFLFPTSEGNADSGDNIRVRGLQRAMKAAGIKKATSPHDLRHTFASSLFAAGVDIVRVSALLGHASPAVTLAVYSHLIPASRSDAATKLEAFFAGVDSTPVASSKSTPSAA